MQIVLKIKNLKNNYGFIIISFIFLIYILTLLIFITSSYEKLKKEIKLIILALNLNETPKKNIDVKNQVIIKKQKKERKNVKNKITKKNRIIY